MIFLWATSMMRSWSTASFPIGHVVVDRTIGECFFKLQKIAINSIANLLQHHISFIDSMKSLTSLCRFFNVTQCLCNVSSRLQISMKLYARQLEDSHVYFRYFRNQFVFVNTENREKFDVSPKWNMKIKRSLLNYFIACWI